MPDRESFLRDLKGNDIDARFVAWRSAAEMDASVIPELAQLAGTGSPGVVKAALGALTTLVHSVGKQSGAEKRKAVVKELLSVAGGQHSDALKAEALRLLSLVAGDDSVPAIARWLDEVALFEEVVFCLERIPGQASIKALAAAYPKASDESKARILAALGHRRAEEGVALCVRAMASPNKDLATAAMKAFGRIGKRPAAPAPTPASTGLGRWQVIDRLDAMLRWADSQAEQGNHTEAMRIYRRMLDQEPHWQCAALIGIGRIATPEAATEIFPKLSSKDRTVRITAEKAWRDIAAAQAKRSG
jgi:hypothetical protein